MEETSSKAAQVVLLQPVCVVDHLCQLDEQTAARLSGGQLGGSSRVTSAELQQLLLDVGQYTTRAGGSASNVARGLSAAFGIATAVVGARGCDEHGSLWEHAMQRSGVDTRHVLRLPGATGRSVVLLAAGERSCRTCLDPEVSFPASSLQEEALRGASWLFVSGYAVYQDNLLLTALRLAKQLGLKTALDLASWELLQRFWPLLEQALTEGLVTLCFCNQEEAAQLCSLRQLQQASAGPEGCAEAALAYLLQHCETAVVTLGRHGCLAGTRASAVSSRSCSRCNSGSVPEVALPASAAGGPGAVVAVRQPGVAGIDVVDVTGAGDAFAAGFLHGVLRGWPLQRCAEAACLSGAAAVQMLGADYASSNSGQQLRWMHRQLLGPHAAATLAASAGEVAREQLAAFGLVEKLGRGVVYFGSARVQPADPLWAQTADLARQVSQLLGVTTWTGGGPGLMQAASQGAAEAGAVGGIRLAKEAGTTVLSGGYLPPDAQVLCRSLSSRKAGLVQAGCRYQSSDRTAFIFLPGGLGTMDELFEVLTLLQLHKLPQQHAATSPLILMDYDGFYQGFLTFLQGCEQHGMLRAEELEHVVVASSNSAAVALLAAFYAIGCDDLSSSAAAGGSSGSSQEAAVPAEAASAALSVATAAAVAGTAGVANEEAGIVPAVRAATAGGQQELSRLSSMLRALRLPN